MDTQRVDLYQMTSPFRIVYSLPKEMNVEYLFWLVSERKKCHRRTVHTVCVHSIILLQLNDFMKSGVKVMSCHVIPTPFVVKCTS